MFALAAHLLALLPLSPPLQEPPTVRLTPAELALASRIDRNRAAARVRELVALGPRLGGSPSARRALQLRAQWMESAGLGLERRADGELDWWEPARWRVIARADGVRRDLVSAWPLPGAPGLSAEGLLLDLDDGAGGALLANAGGGRSVPGRRLVLTDGRSTEDGRYSQIRPGGTETPVLGLGRRDGAFLRGLLEGGSAVELDVVLETEAGRGTVETLVATLPAREGAPPGYLLCCAHADADSGGPGANDNASGESIVLEIAQAWAEAVAQGRIQAPAVELRFAWWGSEIFSSRAFAAASQEAGQPPLLGVLNFDQCGYGAGLERLYVEPDDLPQNVALVNEVLGVLEDAAGADGFPTRWASVKSLGGTDSYVFSGDAGLRARGVPSVTVYASAWGRPAAHPRTEGMPGESWRQSPRVEVDHDPWYHSSGDLPQNTTDREPWHLAWEARAGAIALGRFAERIASSPGARAPDPAADR